MLCPGTLLSSPMTVSRDVHQLYQTLSIDIKTYFQNLNTTIHLVIDGWTAPIVASYLGIIIIWCSDGLIHRQTLEFIRYVNFSTQYFIYSSNKF